MKQRTGFQWFGSLGLGPVLGVALAFGACGGSSISSSGSETNWLKPCQTDADCGPFSCVCSLCTLSCEDSADCAAASGTARCLDAGGSGGRGLCGTGEVPDAFCVEPCSIDSDCQDGSRCESGVCRAPVSGKKPAGANCDDADECASGICEGQGCASGAGVCAELERTCTDDSVEYCGCDGVTFSGSSSCPAGRYEHAGACEGGAPGEACDIHRDCASGICEGLGCGSGEGVCAETERGCTEDDVSYCGCDGKTFLGSGSCPGARYEHVGACEGAAPGEACDSDADCASGICEGEGCGPSEGVCAEHQRECTADVVGYCGCDGETFTGSSNCPGGRYEHRGECGPDDVGMPCDSGGDCASGICEGEGCGFREGVCAAAGRACDLDLVSYCGCDGNSFSGSSDCAGGRYAYVGECQGAADGEPCQAHGDCESGICEGEGCDSEQGACAPRERACTDDIASYCGCDGETFTSSGSCPGDRYQHRGACE